MPKINAPVIPDTRLLRRLMEEYQDMLREVERGVKKVLTLDPETEKFWDELAELDPHLTLIEARSNSISEEILDLIDQLPED